MHINYYLLQSFHLDALLIPHKTDRGAYLHTLDFQALPSLWWETSGGYDSLASTKGGTAHGSANILSAAQGALQYFKIFARTMQREWFGIDKLRLDKFMMLARKFLHQLYAHLQKSGWCASKLLLAPHLLSLA